MSKTTKWARVELGSVCNINPPKNEVSNIAESDLVSFIPMQNISENQKVMSVSSARPFLEVSKGSYTYFRNSDVLLAKVTPCFENGKAGIASDLINGIGFGSSELHALRASDRLSPDFLYRLVTSPHFRAYAVPRMTGTGGLRRVPASAVASYQIPLPPLPEQRRIAAILDTADLIRQKRKAAITKLDELAQAVFYEMFGDPVKNEKGWGKSRISDVCELNPSKIEARNIPSLSSVTFLPMQYLYENQMEIDGTNARQLSEVSTGSYTYFANNDVLIAKVTPCFENGKAGIARDLINGIGFGSSELHVVRAGNKVCPEYIYSILTSSRFRTYATKRMTGTGGLRRVPIDAIADLAIAVPPKELQESYINICSFIESMRSRVHKALIKDDSLFKSLQHRAFAGEL